MFTPKITVEKLKKKSQDIVNVFEKTKNDLISVNNEIIQEEEPRQTEITKLQNEMRELFNQKTSNNKLIEKITDFLS